jgi:hypothetical protein
MEPNRKPSLRKSELKEEPRGSFFYAWEKSNGHKMGIKPDF